MGAALSTRRADPASAHWPLLREYLGHSMRSLGECASIFMGRSAIGDGLDGDCEDDDNDEDDEGGGGGGRGYLPSAYPRYLTLGQFEEVFGLLVADARPHFAFFQPTNAPAGSANVSVVCAHQVFCGLALLARADLHAKVQFVLRLYATDAHGQLPSERRRVLLRDFLAAVARVLALAEPVEHQVASYLEKELVARNDAALATCRELYAFCVTTARISGFLHEIQSVVDELARLRDKLLAPHAVDSSARAVNTLAGGGSGHLKLLNRGATMLQLPHEALLWSMRAHDPPWFWRQDHVVLPDDTLVCDALCAMQRQDRASTVLVLAPRHTAAATSTTTTAYAGLLTLDDLFGFLVDLLPEDAAATPSMGEYMRAQVAKAGQLFAHSSLRAVLLASAPSRGGVGTRPATRSSARHQCVGADECFFNVILRLACGGQAVAVLTAAATTTASTTQDASPISSDALLGQISVLDVLEWLLGDLSLLNGKERFAVASFPWFYYTPTTLVIPTSSAIGQPRPWLLDAIVAMHTQKTTGVLVATGEALDKAAYVLSAESIREAFAAHDVGLESKPGDDDAASRMDALTPLHFLLTKLPHAMQPACCVQSEDSLAHVVATMVATRSRRVYIRDPLSETVQGAIRATDILRLLLQEQHCKPRRA